MTKTKWYAKPTVIVSLTSSPLKGDEASPEPKP